MSSRLEASKLASGEVERLAAERAREKANLPKWDVNTVIVAYAVLIAVVILGFRGVVTEIVAPIAMFGLGTVWFSARRRGKHQYKNFYEEELRQLQELLQRSETKAFTLSPLSPRETEILSYIARGYINKQVAHRLGISEQTIKNHMSSILRKLDVNDRTQAVVLAMYYGWVLSQDQEPRGPIGSSGIGNNPHH